MIIQNVEFQDLSQINDLYRYFETRDPPPVPGLIEQIWANIQKISGLVYIVSEESNRIISTCNLTLIPNLNHSGRSFGLIENVVTHSDYRGRRIGSSVLKFALNIAWKKYGYKVMLLTGSKKEETLCFYEKAGFLKGIKTGFIAYSADNLPGFNS